MKKRKNISQKIKRAAALFLLFHFIFSPVLAAVPYMNCESDCSLEMFSGCDIDSHKDDNIADVVQENTCGCCSYGETEQMENASSQQDSDDCDLMLDARDCELTSGFLSIDFTVTFKYEQKANFTTIATLTEVGELFSAETIYSTGLVKLNGPPIFIINSSFLN